MTFLYGSNSWTSNFGTLSEKEDAPGSNLECGTVIWLEEAGHHIYADQPKLFNNAVIDAMK